MKLGLLSAILGEFSFEQVIEIAAEIGYQCVELASWPVGKSVRKYAGVTHLDVSALDDKYTKRIGECCRFHNVEISALAYYPNPLDPNQEVREAAANHIKNLIDAAVTLGVYHVNTFIGKDKTKPVEQNFEDFLKVWPAIIRYAEQRRVYIGIENCPMYFTESEWPGGNNLASTPKIWRRMFREIDSDYFGLNYDPSHLYLQGMDYIKPLYEFRDKIFHAHIKDIKMYPDKINDVGLFSYPLEYMSPKLPGLGDMDWGAFLSALYDIEYDGAICMELEDRTFEKEAEGIMNAVRLSYRYISQFIS